MFAETSADNEWCWALTWHRHSLALQEARALSSTHSPSLVFLLSFDHETIYILVDQSLKIKWYIKKNSKIYVLNGKQTFYGRDLFRLLQILLSFFSKIDKSIFKNKQWSKAKGQTGMRDLGFWDTLFLDVVSWALNIKNCVRSR